DAGVVDAQRQRHHRAGRGNHRRDAAADLDADRGAASRYHLADDIVGVVDTAQLGRMRTNNIERRHSIAGHICYPKSSVESFCRKLLSIHPSGRKVYAVYRHGEKSHSLTVVTLK